MRYGRLSMIIVALALGSCANQYEAKTLPPNIVDSTYTKIIMKWTGMFEGSQSTYYVKSFKSGGMLAICALRIETTGSMAQELEDTWLWNAFVTEGNIRVAKSQFLAAVPEGKPRSQWLANCIETKTPASDQLLDARVRIVGGEVLVWF